MDTFFIQRNNSAKNDKLLKILDEPNFELTLIKSNFTLDCEAQNK